MNRWGNLDRGANRIRLTGYIALRSRMISDREPKMLMAAVSKSSSNPSTMVLLQIIRPVPVYQPPRSHTPSDRFLDESANSGWSHIPLCGVSTDRLS